MADNSQQAWSQVGEKFSSWGRRVAVHYRDAGEATSTSAQDAEKELQRFAKEVVDELSKGFTTVSKTLSDDQASQELGAAFNAIGDAITATVNEASRAIRSGSSRDQSPPD